MSPDERLEVAWEQIPNALVASTCVFLDRAGVVTSQGLQWWVPSGLVRFDPKSRNAQEFQVWVQRWLVSEPSPSPGRESPGVRLVQGSSRLQKLNRNWISLEPAWSVSSISSWITYPCLNWALLLRRQILAEEEIAFEGVKHISSQTSAWTVGVCGLVSTEAEVLASLMAHVAVDLWETFPNPGRTFHPSVWFSI